MNDFSLCRIPPSDFLSCSDRIPIFPLDSTKPSNPKTLPDIHDTSAQASGKVAVRRRLVGFIQLGLPSLTNPLHKGSRTSFSWAHKSLPPQLNPLTLTINRWLRARRGAGASAWAAAPRARGGQGQWQAHDGQG